MTAAIEQLQRRIKTAADSRTALRIVGGDTRTHLGRTPTGEPLPTTALRGIVHYQPTELAVTVLAGTSIVELEQALAEHNQMLAFEPPVLGPHSTVGGMVASGLSGPRRPFAGALRDALLGVRIINGNGEYLHFGGEVMKNVAGYDVSRLMAGAWGTLGVIVEASFKVLPHPQAEVTLACETTREEALSSMQQLAGQPLPLSAASFDGRILRIRLSGSVAAIEAAQRAITGDIDPEGNTHWDGLRHLQHPFFDMQGPLWRCSVPPATPPLPIDGEQLIDWAGALRWVKTDLPPEEVRKICANAGGHATLFTGGDRDGEVFHPLPPALFALHRRLKQAFDPHGILNPGRMYPEL